MIGIIGTGGHSKVIIDILQLSDPDHQFVFFNQGSTQHSYLNDHQILSDRPSLLQQWIARELKWHVAIGNPVVRQEKLQWLQLQRAPLLTVIHPKSIISPTVSFGNGSSVMAGAVINPYAYIGAGCIINTSSSIDHDCSLEDYVNVGPGSHLAGGAHIGSGSDLGAGCIVLPNIQIGRHCTVGAGSVVTKDLPDNCVAYGVPAKIKNLKH